LARALLLILSAFLIVSCTAKVPLSDRNAVNSNNINMPDAANNNTMTHNTPDFSFYLAALSASQLPENIKSDIRNLLTVNSAFTAELDSILDKTKDNFDPYLFFLVDKDHSLGEDYAPDDLVELKSGSYLVNRTGLMLRSKAAQSLEEMSAAAKAEGLTLVASSSYRSYVYQKEVYSTWVRQLGQEAADRVSARPGYSQHQLGTTLDFGSITNDFAQTREGVWLSANAWKFGWSLSYPRDFEHITGYSWESWHFRYVGKEIASFIEKYFEGVQQYALRFIHEYAVLIQ